MESLHFYYYLKSVLVACFISGAVIFAYSVQSVQAATITWDGGGTDGTCGGGAGDGNKWSCGANWSTDTVPTTSDVATFNATSTKNATINSATTNVGSINIASGYSGIVMQASGVTLTVSGTSLSDFTIASGTFQGGDGLIEVDDQFTVSGGTFNSTSGILRIDGGDFTVSSGTFDPGAGSVEFNGSAIVINVATTETFNDVDISNATNSATAVTSGDTMIVAGDLTLTDGLISGGAVQVAGNIVQEAAFDGGTSTLDFIGAGAQTYTINGGDGPVVELDEAADASDVIIFTAAGGLSGLTITSGFSGTVPISNASDFSMSFSSWSQAAGTFDGSSYSVITVNDFAVTGGTFTAPDLISVTGGAATWNVNVSQDFNDLTVNLNSASALSFPAADTLNVLGVLTLSNGVTSGGTMSVHGNINQAAAFDGGTATLEFGGAGAQVYTISGGSGPGIELDEAADASDSIVLEADASVRFFTVTSDFSGTIPISNAGDFHITVPTWTQAAGTFEGASTSELTLADLTISGGTFNAPTTVYTDVNISPTFNVNVSQTFTNLTLNTHGSGAFTLGSVNDTLIVTGALTMNTGGMNTGVIKAQGSLTSAAGNDGGSMIVDFDSASAQSLTISGGSFPVLRLDAAEDANDSVTITTASTIDGLTMTSNFSGEAPLVNSGDNVITFNAITLGGGTLDLSETSSISMGDFIQTGSGVFVAPTLVTFALSSPSYSVDVTQALNDVTINTVTGFSIPAEDTMTVTGDYLCSNGVSNNGALEVYGDVTLSSGCDAMTTSLLLSGSATQALADSTVAHDMLNGI